MALKYINIRKLMQCACEYAIHFLPFFFFLQGQKGHPGPPGLPGEAVSLTHTHTQLCWLTTLKLKFKKIEDHSYC